MRQVTKEIADYIYRDYEVLKLGRVKQKDILFKTIQSDVENDFGTKITSATLVPYVYYTIEEVKKRRKKYNRKYMESEKGKETIKNYVNSERYKELMKDYYQRRKEARKIYYPKNKKRLNLKQKRYYQRHKAKNPGYAEFLDSIKKFENKIIIDSINPDNTFLKVLLTIRKSDHPLKGKEIAKDTGLKSVKGELKVLTAHKLIEHSTRLKYDASESGIAYLKTTGFI
jgi:hypothetical protein